MVRGEINGCKDCQNFKQLHLYAFANNCPTILIICLTFKLKKLKLNVFYLGFNLVVTRHHCFPPCEVLVVYLATKVVMARSTIWSMCQVSLVFGHPMWPYNLFFHNTKTQSVDILFNNHKKTIVISFSPRFNTCNIVQLARDFKICPCNLLRWRSRVLRAQEAENIFGIRPLILLFLKFNMRKVSLIFIKHEGIVLEIFLMERSRTSRYEAMQRESGILLCKVLFERERKIVNDK